MILNEDLLFYFINPNNIYYNFYKNLLFIKNSTYFIPRFPLKNTTYSRHYNPTYFTIFFLDTSNMPKIYNYIKIIGL